ncbi:MAG: phage tail tape measure protein [Candidatus Sedimenticola sp. (ex Thyasira tokunagai)]
MSDDLDLSITLRAIDKFSGPARKIAQTSEKMAKHLNEGQRALYKIGNDRKSIKRLKELNGKLGETSAGLKEAKREVAYFRRQVELGGKAAAKQFGGDLEKAKKKALRLAAAERKLTEQTGSLSAKLRTAKIDTANLRGEQDRLGASYGKVVKKMERMSALSAKVNAAQAKHDRALQRAANTALVAGGAQRVGRGLIGAVSDPMREAINFESAMADVKKVVNFTEAGGAEKLGRQLINMTKVIPIAKEGLAAIAASGGQLGVAADKLPAFVETAAKMATAFDMLPEDAGDAMAKLSNIYQIPIEQMGRLGDVINHLSDNTAAKAREIVPVLQRIGGTARQFGLSAVNAAALGDAFISLGKRPEVAATAINAMLNKMQTATKQGEKFQGALGSIGLSATALEQAIAKDGQGALQGFLDRISKLDKQTRAGVLTELFGLEYADDISLLAGNLGKYHQALGLVANGGYAGSMENEFKQRSSTKANRLQLMQQRWDAVQQRMGEKLLPVLERLLNVLEPIIDGIGSWIDKHPHLTQGLLVITGGMGALALAIAPVITSVAALGAAITWMGLRARKASLNAGMGGGGGFGGNLKGKGLWGKVKGIGKGLSGKAGLIGAGIGALSIGATLADGAMSGAEKASSIGGDVGGIGGALGGALAGAAIGSAVPIIGTAIGGLLGSIIGGLGGSSAGDWIGGKVGGLFNSAEPAMGASGNSSTVDKSQHLYKLNISQQPGEDGRAFAERVADALRQMQQQQAGSAMFDPA